MVLLSVPNSSSNMRVTPPCLSVVTPTPLFLAPLRGVKLLQRKVENSCFSCCLLFFARRKEAAYDGMTQGFIGSELLILSQFLSFCSAGRVNEQTDSTTTFSLPRGERSKSCRRGASVSNLARTTNALISLPFIPRTRHCRTPNNTTAFYNSASICVVVGSHFGRR